MSTHSQIEPDEGIQMLADSLLPIGEDILIQIRAKVYESLTIRPIITDRDAVDEKEIRWKRSAAQILSDGFVYRGKSCTDVSVLYIAICIALGLEARLVKLVKEHKTHSVVEVCGDGEWHIIDVSSTVMQPIRGIITEETPYLDWRLWKKAPDAWSMGLHEFSDQKRVLDEEK